MSRIGSSRFDLEEALTRVSHLLPHQGPIKDFIHHNTLHSYQGRPFHEGVRVAARMTGARPYLSLSEFRKLYRKGDISESCLNKAIKMHSSSFPSEATLRRDLFESTQSKDREHRGVAYSGLRSRWLSRYRIDMNACVQPVLFRLAAGYLDQGIANLRMPETELPLFESVRALIDHSWIRYPIFGHPIGKKWLTQNPTEVIPSILREFVTSEKHFERYLTELCLSQPGWAGMIRVLEDHPEGLVLRRTPLLRDWLALTLIAESVVVEQYLGPSFEAGGRLATDQEEVISIPMYESAPAPTETERLQEVWQEALDLSHSSSLIRGLMASRPVSAQPSNLESKSARSGSVQVVFCIDDRECSIRRHLEEVDPEIETFGTAGFFGIDCVFQGSSDSFPFKHCPVPVSPKHMIMEIQSEVRLQRESEMSRGLGQFFLLEPRSNTFFRGWLIGQTLGFWAALKLAVSIFRPSLEAVGVSSLRRVDSRAKLRVARGLQGNDSPSKSKEGYWLGYTPEEMADRVGGLLRSIGAVQSPLASFFVLLGHGGSSVNNPYFSAYDCGACSGKAGAPNARAFALMANDPEVRSILAARGCVIAAETKFIGGLHDTTRDEVQFYDLDGMTVEQLKDFDRFRSSLGLALMRNAKERCRRFMVLPELLSIEEAAKEVKVRSVGIFEPRPELNHATNAACIVGCRSFTRGLFLDRRCFLNSYDYRIDSNGDILAGILGAVVPVCGGINLEYFFSRVDPDRYGSGSKLPHNVVGLIGVSNGTDSDLLTGLPTQMTEVHDPVRLSLIIEQEPEIALMALTRNDSVFEWVKNGWVKFFCFSPIRRKMFRYEAAEMMSYDEEDFSDLPHSLDSFAAVAQSRENIPVQILDGGKRI